jgi:hypothetical protein
MNDFLSKLENFVFDILGLILPGSIFLLTLMSPLLFVDLSEIPNEIIDDSLMLSVLTTILKMLSTYWAAYPKSALIIALILAYLAGHVVKVFSIIKYDFLTALFDRRLNKLSEEIFNKIKNWIPLQSRQSSTYAWFKEIFRPFKLFIQAIFVFKAPYRFKDDAFFMENCAYRLNSRLSTTYAYEEKSISKISSIIATQEQFRNIGTFFLAKYNLYRSLALIFLFTTFYYISFFRAESTYIKPSLHQISSIIFAAPVILWFTFHVKYKRYWTLYGQERIMSLFYILNKKKINEG